MLNPFDPSFQNDPYPQYRDLPRVSLLEVAGFRVWLVARFEEVQACLRDPRLSSEAVPREVLPREIAEGMMFYMDAPDHIRLRAAFVPAFAPSRMEQLRLRVNALVGEIFARAGSRIEIVTELARPLSLRILGELLGVPAEDLPQLQRWSDELCALVDVTRALGGLEGAARAAREMAEYVRALPKKEGLIAILADKLSESELVGSVMFTLVAGHETTTGLIGNAAHALTERPELCERLRREPWLWPSAVDELLRFDSPVQLTTRLAKAPLELGGQSIARGEPVCLLFGAANRDPEKFVDPDVIDPAREARHIAFGHGAHYCVGAALAKIEAQVALAALVARAPRRVGIALRKPGVVLRGFERLEVELHQLQLRKSLVRT
jgi:cytochrome P450